MEEINENLEILMTDALKDTVKKLLEANNTVTTLEVKNTLRSEYKSLYWTQEFISDTMKSMSEDGTLEFEDQGTYRIYSYPNPLLSKKDKKKIKKSVKKERLKVLLNSLITPYNVQSQNTAIKELAVLLKIELDRLN